jgi:hypothetical protein
VLQLAKKSASNYPKKWIKLQDLPSYCTCNEVKTAACRENELKDTKSKNNTLEIMHRTLEMA